MDRCPRSTSGSTRRSRTSSPDSAAAATVAPPLGRTRSPTAPDGQGHWLWLGPDEWLVVGPEGGGHDIAPAVEAALREAAGDAFLTTVDVSANRVGLEVCRRRMSIDLLAFGCSLDLDDRAFPAGACAQTMRGPGRTSSCGASMTVRPCGCSSGRRSLPTSRRGSMTRWPASADGPAAAPRHRPLRCPPKERCMDWTLAARAEKMNPSVIREILKVTERPGIISFAGGLPSPKTFPVTRLRRSLREGAAAGRPGRAAVRRQRRLRARCARRSPRCCPGTSIRRRC